jgi:hypothetical protein
MESAMLQASGPLAVGARVVKICSVYPRFCPYDAESAASRRLADVAAESIAHGRALPATSGLFTADTEIVYASPAAASVAATSFSDASWVAQTFLPSLAQADPARFSSASLQSVAVVTASSGANGSSLSAATAGETREAPSTVVIAFGAVTTILVVALVWMWVKARKMSTRIAALSQEPGVDGGVATPAGRRIVFLEAPATLVAPAKSSLHPSSGGDGVPEDRVRWLGGSTGEPAGYSAPSDRPSRGAASGADVPSAPAHVPGDGGSHPFVVPDSGVLSVQLGDAAAGQAVVLSSSSSSLAASSNVVVPVLNRGQGAW